MKSGGTLSLALIVKKKKKKSDRFSYVTAVTLNPSTHLQSRPLFQVHIQYACVFIHRIFLANNVLCYLIKIMSYRHFRITWVLHHNGLHFHTLWISWME